MSPEFLDKMSWAMAEVYGAVTDRILINLAKYFPYIRHDREAKDLFEYQARMLAQMGKVTRETVDIITGSLDGADEALREALESSIMDALQREEPSLRKAAEQGLLQGQGLVPPEVTPNMMQAFQSYYQQSADKLNLVNTVMLESTQAAYQATVADVVNRIQVTQSALNVAAGEVVTGVSAWNTAMHDAVQKMVLNNLTGFVDHGGHHWTPEAYVAMDIRTTMFNTARAAIWERSEQYGADLYQVSSHNGARPLCYPWQGKVISRSGWTGEVEDLDGLTVHVYAQSETTYGEAAGLFGVNCKHYPMTFIPGFSTLKGRPQSEEANEESYALSQEQRRLERKLRDEKRDLAVMKAQGADDAIIAKQQTKVDGANAELAEFCTDHELPRRRNREYTPIKASFPDDGTYDSTQFPTETRDRMREWFGGSSAAVDVQSDISYKQFKNGEEANEYFGQRPPISMRRENRVEYDRLRAEYNDSMFGKWYNTLTPEETKSIGEYSSDTYAGVNGLLRGRMTKSMVDKWQVSAGDSLENIIGDIDSALEKFELNEPIKVFRTCDNNMLPILQNNIGGIFTDYGYTSTSVLSEKVASGNVVIEINVPSGKNHGAWINPLSGAQDKEYEFLLPRGGQYRINTSYQRGEDTVFEMDFLGSEKGKIEYATKEHVAELWREMGINPDEYEIE